MLNQWNKRKRSVEIWFFKVQSVSTTSAFTPFVNKHGLYSEVLVFHFVCKPVVWMQRICAVNIFILYRVHILSIDTRKESRDGFHKWIYRISMPTIGMPTHEKPRHAPDICLFWNFVLETEEITVIVLENSFPWISIRKCKIVQL